MFKILIGLLLSSCGLFQLIANTPEDALPPSAEIQSIYIEDNWNGLSPIAPIIAQFIFTPNGDVYTGSAHFEVGGYSADGITTANETVEIPVEVVNQFLDKLAETELVEGTYTPSITHTDDYPDLKIQVATLDSTTFYYSQSQGETHAPWGATIDGVDYTIESGIPMEALEILIPYLKYDVLQQLTEEAQYDG